MPAHLTDLEKLIGHRFKDFSLLERAVTHRSWVFENPNEDGGDTNERDNELSEFIGDSVLGLAIAEALFRSHPGLGEGDLTLMKHSLVSTATLAKLGEEMNLGEYLRVGRGEEKTGGRKKQALLANTLEAVIGAVFLDSGYVVVRSVIGHMFADYLKSVSPESSLDYKSLLQETLQANRKAAPIYSIISTDGPPHERIFHVEAVWDGGTASGEGSSIKAAEMQAANEALMSLGVSKAKHGRP